VVSVRMYLSSAIALACLTAAPAFAEDPDWPSIPESTAHVSAYDNDFPTSAAPLRPAVPANAIDWSGFYLGGDFSYSDLNGDFSSSTQAPIAYSLRESVLENSYDPSSWPVLGSASHAAAGGGGFIGYNFVYAMPTSKVVLGIEANYDQSSLSLIAPNAPISRITSGNSYLVNITGSGQVSNLDFGTLRARAGWAFGNFLPYAFIGAALGRADVNVTETTFGQQNPPTSGACSGTCVPFSFSGTAGKDGEWLYGLSFGAGLDVALTRNIFIRAEYEYVQFQPVASVNLNVNTFRAGAGFKF
jgi:outer membrane immunogenic protein